MKESLLDHIYINDITRIEHYTKRIDISDHMLVIADVLINKTKNTENNDPIYKRDWTKYSKEKLKTQLARQNLQDLTSLESTSI